MTWFLSQGPASVFDPCPSLQTMSFFSVWVYPNVDGNISTSVTQSSGSILLLNQRTRSSWGRQWRSHPSGGWLVLPDRSTALYLSVLGIWVMARLSHARFRGRHMAQSRANYGVPSLFIKGGQMDKWLRSIQSSLIQVLMLKNLEKRNVPSSWIEERTGWRLQAARSHFVSTGREPTNGANSER